MELLQGLSSLDSEVTKAFEGADSSHFGQFWLSPGLQRQLKGLLELAKGLKTSRSV